MNTLVWVGFSQSLFVAVLMFTKRGSSFSDKILSAWLVLSAVEFMTCGLDYEIFGKPLLSSSFLLFNPALYLYVQSLTRSGFELKYRQLLHLLPFVLFETCAYVIKEPVSLDVFFVYDHNLYFRILFAIANLLSWMVYNPLSIKLVHKYRINLRNERSNIGKNENLGWILAVAIFYVVYCLLAIIISAAVIYFQLNPLIPHVYNYIMLLFMVYVMGFYGLRQQVVPRHLQIEKTASYKNSLLNADEKQQIQKKIVDFFEKEQAFLNPDLNMDALSEELKIPKYQLTEVLNTQIGKNFFQFVNSYRVEAVKRMLVDPNNKYSIEAIGYECGFSSKSAFYSVFKNVTNQTPVGYKNSRSGSAGSPFLKGITF
ncbi:MAG: helix-turn-helix transcriptional regulator [Prevotellaceae bacterium]|jgi:AraC-like DNA-binding protein|nr:helix-turn-helix transcriptional regulator [Prevotellaceae bacterium]